MPTNDQESFPSLSRMVETFIFSFSYAISHLFLFFFLQSFIIFPQSFLSLTQLLQDFHNRIIYCNYFSICCRFSCIVPQLLHILSQSSPYFFAIICVLPHMFLHYVAFVPIVSRICSIFLSQFLFCCRN